MRGAPAPSLDNQYTIWGKVVAGMDAVDKIKRGSGGNGVVQNPDKLIRARITAALAPRTASFDAIVAPTCPLTPPAIAEVAETVVVTLGPDGAFGMVEGEAVSVPGEPTGRDGRIG